MKPEIKKENGATTLDAVVTLSNATLMRTSTKMVTESMDFLKDAKFPDGRERKAYFMFPKTDDYCWKFTSCLDMMELLAMQNPEIRIKVEGEDETAEKIALRLYSALTTENSIDPDFYRFEK